MKAKRAMVRLTALADKLRQRRGGAHFLASRLRIGAKQSLNHDRPALAPRLVDREHAAWGSFMRLLY